MKARSIYLSGGHLDGKTVKASAERFEMMTIYVGKALLESGVGPAGKESTIYVATGIFLEDGREIFEEEEVD